MEVSKQLVETNWFHAENFIWLFDATGSGWSSKPGIEKTLQITVKKITPARQYRLLNKGNRLAIMLPGTSDLYRQKPNSIPVDETELAHPAAIVTRIEGVVSDESRYYYPRRFSLDLAALDTKNPYQNALALYRNINVIPKSRTGSVIGSLRAESGNAFAWALLTLTITVPDEANLVLKAQANQFGDFIIPLNELPALETDSLVSHYSGNLTVQACALIDGIPDVDQLTATQVKPISGGNDFIVALNFNVVPGEQLLLKSQGEAALVVKPGA